MATIVIIEDERELAMLLRGGLEGAGHRVVTAEDGPDGVAIVEREDPDLVILDVMLPGFDGMEVCRRIRRARITPILMLTARSTELDKVLGLELGADDHLTKPFSMRELLARVGALLRRVELLREESRPANDQAPIILPDLTIDPASHGVISDGQPVQLTAKEFDLLRLLAANPGEVVDKYPSLQLADVFAVFAYYLRHQDEVEAYLRLRQQQAEEMQRISEARFDRGELRDRLLARREQQSDR